MHYFYFYEKHIADVNPIPEALLTAPDYNERSWRSSAFAELVEGFDPERERKLNAYLERFFSGAAAERPKDLVLQN